MNILLTDEELTVAYGYDNPGNVAKAQLRKVVDWMRSGGSEQCAFHIDEGATGEDWIKEAPPCVVWYVDKKEWQALLKEVER